MAEIIDEDGKKHYFKLIVIEGPDGVGKSTFSANLAARLRDNDHPYIRHHYPCKTCHHTSVNGRDEVLGWNRVSTPVAEYLGSRIRIVGNPRAIAHIYTQDRLLSWYMDNYIEDGIKCLRERVIEMCENNRHNGGVYKHNTPVLIFDRYTQSSEIYQGADMLDEDQDKFCDWLEDYEYNQLQLPRPDNVIYLDASVEHIIKNIESRSKLIGAAKDLHEIDNDFLADVCVSGRKLAVMRDWDMYNTMDRHGKWVNVEELTKEAYGNIFKV